MYHIVLVLQFKTMAKRFKVQSYRKVVCVVVFFRSAATFSFAYGKIIAPSEWLICRCSYHKFHDQVIRSQCYRNRHFVKLGNRCWRVFHSLSNWKHFDKEDHGIWPWGKGRTSCFLYLPANRMSTLLWCAVPKQRKMYVQPPIALLLFGFLVAVVIILVQALWLKFWGCCGVNARRCNKRCVHV